jgi:hypothetical protein
VRELPLGERTNGSDTVGKRKRPLEIQGPLRVGDTGFEPGDANPTDYKQFDTSAEPCAAKSGAVPAADPLAAFVASLTVEQRAKLVALLAPLPD